MKKKLVMTMLMVTMAVGMVACGQEAMPKDEMLQESSVKQSNEEAREEKVEEIVESVKEDDLPYWKGVWDYVGTQVRNKGGYGVDICYPSLKPASSGWAYQMDPALVFVTTPGLTSDMENISVNSLEETFVTSKDWTIMMLDSFRNYQYADFDFIIENQELVTVNDLDTCKYTGKHTYTLDGVAQEIPFVAYSFDTKVIENYSYITVIVMDDSINNPSMEPLPEGTIEAYAKKMVESVVIKDGSF